MAREILLLFILFSFRPFDVDTTSSIGLAPVPTGSCSKGVTVQNDFNMTAFLGLWYEDKYINKGKVANDGDCGTIEFVRDSTSGGIKATYRDIERTLSGELSEVNSEAKNGKLQLMLHVLHSESGHIKKKNFKYWIMDTDYKCYALVYTCIPGMVVHKVAGWLLVRDNNANCLDSVTSEKIRQIAESNSNWIFTEFKTSDRKLCTEKTYKNILTAKNTQPP